VYRSSCLSFATALLFSVAPSVFSHTEPKLGTAPNAVKAATPADPQLIDLAGYNKVLLKYRGRPLVVTFWATWCEPCRDEFPMLVALHRQYAPEGLAMFGVSLDDDADLHLVRRFLARNEPGFANYRQKPGIDVDAFYRGVNPAWNGTMPETVFYGRDGRIAGHFTGEQPHAAFDRAIRLILVSPTASKSQEQDHRPSRGTP
jgi:thiol-disulfide isomerase/thioredoxin